MFSNKTFLIHLTTVMNWIIILDALVCLNPLSNTKLDGLESTRYKTDYVEVIIEHFFNLSDPGILQSGKKKWSQYKRKSYSKLVLILIEIALWIETYISRYYHKVVSFNTKIILWFSNFNYQKQILIQAFYLNNSNINNSTLKNQKWITKGVRSRKKY